MLLRLFSPPSFCSQSTALSRIELLNHNYGTNASRRLQLHWIDANNQIGVSGESEKVEVSRATVPGSNLIARDVFQPKMIKLLNSTTRERASKA